MYVLIITHKQQIPFLRVRPRPRTLGSHLRRHPSHDSNLLQRVQRPWRNRHRHCAPVQNRRERQPETERQPEIECPKADGGANILVDGSGVVIDHFKLLPSNITQTQDLSLRGFVTRRARQTGLSIPQRHQSNLQSRHPRPGECHHGLVAGGPQRPSTLGRHHGAASR